jgi:hypothetical protein
LIWTHSRRRGFPRGWNGTLHRLKSDREEKMGERTAKIDRLTKETSVRLYWQALRPLDRDLRLYPFFVNAAGEVVENTEQRPLLTQLWFPPRLWQPNEIVMAETMPWILGTQWSLAVGVLAGKDWSTKPLLPIKRPPTSDHRRRKREEFITSSCLACSSGRFQANTWRAWRPWSGRGENWSK